jgi:hypothetical protein
MKCIEEEKDNLLYLKFFGTSEKTKLAFNQLKRDEKIR